MIKTNRQWALDNPEKAYEIRKRFREEKKDIKFKWDKQWKRDNKEYVKEYFAEYRRLNKDAVRKYNLKRMMNKSHEISKEEWEYCKLYFNYSCAYCGILEEQAKIEQGQYLHKEHAINSGSDMIDNCLPSCRNCNSKKWTLDYDEWYSPDNPRYSHDRHMKIEKWLKGDFQMLYLI